MASVGDDDGAQQIVLDCPPGRIRPDDLLSQALKDTGIEPVEASTKVFGEWAFDFSHVPVDKWKACRETLKRNITGLYNNGHIRRGEW